ncbi:TerD family protein [Streptomyces sp. NPDC002577]
MASLNKGLKKVEVRLRWDPSPLGRPPHDLDIVAATYTADEPYGRPSYVVHFGSRSPDGTITLSRDSLTGQGFGSDEVMVLELERLAARHARVVVGVVIQQRSGEITFQDIANARVVIVEGHTELAAVDFTQVAASTAATVAEFTRDTSGEWELHEVLRGFDGDPESFAAVMGSRS